MNLNTEQTAALDLLQSGANVFLTGSAGTGKSTVTTAFVGAALRKVEVAATTGIASINLRDQYAARSGGRQINVSTVYRWAGMGLGPKPGQTNAEYWEWWRAPMTKSKMGVRRRIQAAECLIIDEVSMLPGRVLSYLDYHCQQIRQDHRPFGGIQIVCVGDFLQLPPVDKEGTGYDWAFMTPAWQDAGFSPAVLRQVHRQADPTFVNLLNAFRVGRMDRNTMDVMSRRVIPFCSAAIPRLFTHNAAVDKWNDAQLASLPGEAAKFQASLSGGEEHQRTWLIRNMITPFLLHLKVGARVMITANIADSTGELAACNGSLGTVTAMEEQMCVTVLTDEGRTLELRKHMWDFDQQDSESAKFFQVPLRLAWASTIHKAQGLSLESAYMDIRAAREPGQAYVALSRVRSLAGLYLKAVPGGIFVSKAAAAFHESLNAGSSMSAAIPAPVAEECLY